MRWRLACPWLLALCAGGGLHAEEPQVVSPRPDSVSITIYRDLFALVTETRTVDLPAGPVTLMFEGVVDTLIPQSAVISDTGRALGESNYDFEQLSPAKLLEKSIGRTVLLTRTNRATGKARQVEATVLAANNSGVTFRTAEGNEALHCSGLPERLSFEEVPGELKPRPTLSIRLAAGTPGKRQVRVSYIAHGFVWSADYVSKLDANSGHMDLRGWLTLENLTSTSFRDAQVQVVAGRLNLLDLESGGTSLVGDTADYQTDEDLDEARAVVTEDARYGIEGMLDRPWQPTGYFRGCYPLGTTQIYKREVAGMVDSISAQDVSGYGQELDEVVVTGFRAAMALRENLADYQMYRLPGPTDLTAQQTKQVAFLHKPEVKVERFYGVRIARGEDFVDSLAGDENFMPIDVKVGWRNREDDGLGEPLPGGTVRFFENAGPDTVFTGEAALKDTPVGTPVELVIGKSLDLGLAMEGDEPEPAFSMLSLLARRIYLPINLRVINDKARPVLVEIRQGPIPDFEDLRVSGASLAPKRKAGDYMWRFSVPAHGEQTLSYKVSGRVPDNGD